MAVDMTDVRVFIPAIRRTLEPTTASADSDYSDTLLKNMAADAVGELIAINGDFFPYTLEVTNASAVNSAEDFEYITDPEVPIYLHPLVAVVAAIQLTVSQLASSKSREVIANEGGRWEYETSTTVLKNRLDALFRRRDEVVEQLKLTNPVLITDSWVSTLFERTESLARTAEPYFDGSLS